ncbi:hypothetical protein BpHYR1_042746 [Brachionus plicatilis]|uniref:Uncharacterized protein n=1 Tax=Brachionus plicatilis TaxID=10195 RepID=A0A3M7PRV9_BRAPC|nr:hypothetical protein BpHYR1_042746 [Brachionus plicatilis]
MLDPTEEEWKRWLRNDLLNFPRIQPSLLEEKKHHRKLYTKLLNDFNETKRIEQERQIRRMDRDMNLNRLLSRDEKYLNIGRNKPRSNFFSSNIMNRILQDAAKYSRNQSKNRSSDNNFSINFQDETPCPRFVRNLKRFDNREYYKLLSQSSEFESEFTLSLPAIGSLTEENTDQNLKAESLILPKIQNEMADEDQKTSSQNLLESNQEQTKFQLPPLIRDQTATLKPKIQMAGFDTKKI